MSIIRVVRRNRYTAIDRRPINDSRLSFRARGVLVWLLDKPDDWQITRESLARETPEGEDAMRSVLKELRDCGYLVRQTVRNKEGRTVTESCLYEVPPKGGNHPVDHWVENRPVENRPVVNRPAVNHPAKDKRLEQKTVKGFTSRTENDGGARLPEWTEGRREHLEQLAEKEPKPVAENPKILKANAAKMRELRKAVAK
jgi:hypothetical protein